MIVFPRVEPPVVFTVTLTVETDAGWVAHATFASTEGGMSGSSLTMNRCSKVPDVAWSNTNCRTGWADPGLVPSWIGRRVVVVGLSQTMYPNVHEVCAEFSQILAAVVHVGDA